MSYSVWEKRFDAFSDRWYGVPRLLVGIFIATPLMFIVLGVLFVAMCVLYPFVAVDEWLTNRKHG